MAATGDVDGLERLDVVNFLNSKVPGNVNGLSRCQKVYDELKTIEKSLKSEASSQCANNSLLNYLLFSHW